MQIRCDSCNQVIPAADVNLDRLLAKCTACNNVFTIASEGSPLAEAPISRGRGVVPLPKGFEVVEGQRDLRIRRKWFSPVAYFLLFFCVAWDGFLVFWYSLAVGGGWNGGFEFLAVLFPIGHVAVGIGLTYYTFALFVNHTTILASQGMLSIVHGPLPWKGVRNVAVQDIRQIYCKQVVRRHRHRDRSTFAVCAVLRSPSPAGESLKLLGGLLEADQALFVEQALEKYLGIADEPVGGELAR